MPFDGRITREDVLRRVRAHPLGETPEAMRADFRSLMLGETTVMMRAGLDVTSDETGIHVRPSQTVSNGKPPIIWFHGGGYVFGSPDTHIRPALYLAERYGFDVILPRYRLAPEHVWPAPLEDAMAAVARHDEYILAGDSAGGHLALVTALRLAGEGRPARALLLFSPNTDRSGLSLTRQRLSAMDPMVSDEDDKRLARMAFSGMAADDPEVSPILDDLALLPPTMVEVGSPEVLLGDATMLYEAGNARGALVRMNITPGLLHMGQLWAPWWKDACDSLDRAAAFAERAELERQRNRIGAIA